MFGLDLFTVQTYFYNDLSTLQNNRFSLSNTTFEASLSTGKYVLDNLFIGLNLTYFQDYGTNSSLRLEPSINIEYQFQQFEMGYQYKIGTNVFGGVHDFNIKRNWRF